MVLKRKVWQGARELFLPLGLFYLYFQVKTIYGGDSGDLVSAAVVGGIPHPPGYPLWTFFASWLVKLPFFTPAWRAGLLSSLPAAATLSFLFLILKKLTGSLIASLVAVLTLAFNYVFWLYAEVAEVFSLNNFFVVFLFWLFLQLNELKETQKLKKKLLLTFLVLGLSLTHHHIIVFTFPGLFYLAWQNKARIAPIFKKNWWQFLLVFLLGLTPLLYLPLTAAKWPAIDWEHPVDLQGFLRLIFRQGYGTFRASVGALNFLTLRFISVFFLFYFYYKDFLFIGSLLMFLGLFFLWRQAKKTYFWFLFWQLLAQIFFVFYASFPLGDDFAVATFERFLLVPYLLGTIFLAFGIKFLLTQLKKLKKLTVGLLFLYPLSLFLLNEPRISVLKNDWTAENYAKDILNSVPEGGILILTNDIPLFNTQYVYYGLGYRQDVKLIRLGSLNFKFYANNLNRFYPDLEPVYEEEPQKAVEVFIKNHQEKLPIFFHGGISPEEEIKIGSWLPWGILWRYFPSPESTPSAQQVFEVNEKLWQSYSDPWQGGLRHFKNLFSSSIFYFINENRKATAKFYLSHGFSAAAKEHLLTVIKNNPKDEEAYYYLGQLAFEAKSCTEAEDYFLKVLKLKPNHPQALGFLRLTYLECFGEQEKAKEFENACLEQIKKKEIPLKDL